MATRLWASFGAFLVVSMVWAQSEVAKTPESVHAQLTQLLDAGAKSGGVVTLPPGEYVLNQGLKLRNATLTGPGATLRFVNPESNKGYLFGVSLQSGAVLRDIALIGEGPRCVPVGIDGGARKVQVRHVTITGGTILLDSNVPNINDILIEGCDFYQGGYGVLLDQECSGENVRIIACHFKENRSDAIELNFPKKEQGRFVRNVVITGNIFERIGPDPNSPTSGFGVGIAAGQDVQITANTFYKCAVQGVHIEDDTDNVTVVGNNFNECGLGHTGGNWTGGVHILKGTKFVTISANNFTRCRYGVSGLSGDLLHDVTVIGNTFRDCERGAWFMQYPRGTFQGNIMEDCGIALELWRSRRWIVTGNHIGATVSKASGEQKPQESVGLRCFGFREFICTGNILDVEVPFDHDNKDWYDENYLIKDNLILRGKSRHNGQPAEKHPGT
ncbi:MAG: right-handed parallel beta-helix repeat-containing protein [Armatimonadia bacterium]